MSDRSSPVLMGIKVIHTDLIEGPTDMYEQGRGATARVTTEGCLYRHRIKGLGNPEYIGYYTFSLPTTLL